MRDWTANRNILSTRVTKPLAIEYRETFLNPRVSILETVVF